MAELGDILMWRKYNRREALRLEGLAAKKKKITSKRGLGVLWLTVKQSDHLYGLSVNVPASALQKQRRRSLMHEKKRIKSSHEIND